MLYDSAIIDKSGWYVNVDGRTMIGLCGLVGLGWLWSTMAGDERRRVSSAGCVDVDVDVDVASDVMGDDGHRHPSVHCNPRYGTRSPIPRSRIQPVARRCV